MFPEHPQCAPSNAAAFQLSSAGLHGLDGDQGSIVFRKEREREDQRVRRDRDRSMINQFVYILSFLLPLCCCTAGFLRVIEELLIFHLINQQSI